MTGLEKCIKNQASSIDDEKISPHFTKYILAIQNKRYLLKYKKKTIKVFLKKV